MTTAQVQIGDGVAVVTIGDTFLAIWRAPSRVHRLQWFGQQIQRAVAANPDGILIAQLILPSSSPPDGPGRLESQALLRHYGDKFRKFVTAALGDAMWMTVVRAMLRGMLLITGQSKLQLIVASESEAIDRLIEFAGPNTPTRAELSAAFVSLYAAIKSPDEPHATA